MTSSSRVQSGVWGFKLAIAFVAGIVTACGTAILADYKEGAVPLKSVHEFQKLLESKELVLVTGVDFKGKQYRFTPDYVQVERATFPEASTKIFEPVVITVVPYSRNPDCALIWSGNYQLWAKYCKH